MGLIEAFDERIQKEKGSEKISAREAVAGMILNGLGFLDKGFRLTLKLFETKALEVLFRPGVLAADCKRQKLRRTLEQITVTDRAAVSRLSSAKWCKRADRNAV